MIYIFAAIGACVAIAIAAILLKRYMYVLVEKRIASYQNDIVAKHCDEVENIYRQMRGWRHDYHNHIQAMKAYLSLDQTDELNDYLGKLDADLLSVDTILKTGNVMVDAILNSKISLAQSKHISVNAKAVVPKTLRVQEIDLCVIIGNLLDNAIEACQRVGGNARPWIRVYLGTHKDLLYISISNSAGGEVEKLSKGAFQPHTYLSTKDLPNHGFGLIRIDKLAEKYKGYVDRQNEKGVFATEIMLPL